MKRLIRLRHGIKGRFRLAAPSSRFGLKLALTGAVAALVALNLDWSRVAAAWRGLSAAHMLGAAALIALTQALIGLRWAWLGSRVAGVPAGRAFRDGLLGSLFSLVTPAGVGGDVYRVAAGSREARVRTGAIVVIERLLGIFVYALVFLASFSLLSGKQDGFMASLAPWIVATSIVALVLGAAGRKLLVALLARIAGARTAGLTAALAQIRAGSASVWGVAFVATLASTLAWIGAAVLLSGGLAVRPPPAGVAATAVIAELSRILPISVQGVGVREAAFGLGFADLGAAFADGVLVGAVLYVIHAAVVMAVGLPALSAGRPATVPPLGLTEKH